MSDKKILSFDKAAQAQSGEIGENNSSADQTTETRLSAILAADVVGYTRLVEEDTAATVVAWQDARDNKIEPSVDRHRGRVIKFTGDGFLAEFPTVQKAVECAIELQEELQTSHLVFRMGVSMGDIIDDGRDVHGEGVNIAARLEEIADPGGICISGDVHNLVRNRIDEEFVDLGQQKVKHVSQSVAVYAIKRLAQAEKTSERQSGENVHQARLYYAAAAASLLILVFAVVWFFEPWRKPVAPPVQQLPTAAITLEAEPLPPGPAENPRSPAQDPSIAGAKGPLSPGKIFRDCNICPTMIVVPAGSFMMGWKNADADEGPVHKVSIPVKFAVGKFEVTFSEWDSCTSSGGCSSYNPNDKGWGRDNRPVINVSWDDAQAYVKWLRGRTGAKYRLLTEAEWEYAARGGASTMYPWGVTIDAGKANYGLFRNKTVPAGLYDANAFGLYDIIGNVWEWVADCYSKDAYSQHRAYPSPFLKGGQTCRRVLRGGAWNVDMSDGANLLRTSIREQARSNGRYSNYGFRVARTVE